WNGTESDFPAASCLHQLVEAQVERAPQAIAVSGHGPQLTYRELERRASDLAGELRRHGVGPEVRVALLCERTPLLVVAVLGVLKAGGAFLPLDPSHPRRHLAFILEDAEIEVVLSQASLAERLPGAPRTVVLLDQPTEQERPAPAPRVGPDNPAYVIYTSGSTGRPKGVRITHRAAVNFLTSMGRQPGLEPSDTLLAVTTLAFDISVLELFLPLIRGARVEVADRSALRDGVRLGERIRSSRATVVQATPATWQLLLESGWQPARELRILCGGESLTRPLATRLEQRGAAVWNLYGPTETTVWSALHRVRGAAGPVPIGRPIANTRIYLLDRDLQPLPSGVAGELFIGGSGLARGYLKRPALTAERFIPDPLGPEPGACLYRTGDLARYLADGGIEFLGRLDHQVKIRGFRIELGEIEAVLSEHSAIREVVVAARRDPTGDSRLVAYVVPERRDRDRDPEEPAASGLESPDSSVFRAELRERLPEYMVPSLFVELAALPLTPSGKVDRRSLPVPRLGRRAAGEFAAPRTPLEEMVADIWSEVLDRTPIGIRDDFFELGGHSLLATQMISRVRSALMVEVPLPKFFERPTVAALAQILEAALRAGEKLAAPPLERRSRDADPALSFAQQRLWFLHQLDPQNPAYHIPCEVRITGPLEPAALRLSFDELVRRHEVLRTTFTVRDGGPVEVIRGPAPVTLPLVDCTGVPGVQSALVTESARREACRPFSLEHGPLLRLALLRLEAGEHVLLITLHHIISDAWSMQVLIREIGTLYNAIVDGEPPALPRLPIQYADFACWQRRWLR
ncbi:MAG: amino acid adenylation domain-containing protein, partial [bacterium]|nr:amino acid adenylation domain-containing protein [bacterium]